MLFSPFGIKESKMKYHETVSHVSYQLLWRGGRFKPPLHLVMERREAQASSPFGIKESKMKCHKTVSHVSYHY